MVYLTRAPDPIQMDEPPPKGAEPILSFEGCCCLLHGPNTVLFFCFFCFLPNIARWMCWPADSLVGFRARRKPRALLGTPITSHVASWVKNKDATAPASYACPGTMETLHFKHDLPLVTVCHPQWWRAFPSPGRVCIWPDITQQSPGNCFCQEQNKLICLAWIMCSPCAPCKSDRRPEVLGLDGSVNNFTTTIILQFWIFAGDIMP